MWATLTDDEKKVYQDQASLEKERLAADLQAWKDAGGQLVEEELLPENYKYNSNTLIYPCARVRKICKLDPDVRGLSKEALMLVTKAAEIFTAKLGTETMRVAAIQNRRKLQANDVAQVCSSREQYLFLREDMADLTRLQQKEKTQEKSASTKQQSSLGKAQPAPFAGKPLTSYFTSKTK
jgi:DNA-directed RNA polymerase I subunit RPA43